MDLLSYCEIKPVVNQVEFHPYLNQKNLYKYCMDNGIFITAYNSLTKGDYVSQFSHKLNLLEETKIKELAEKHQTTAGLICLNWALTQEIIVIPATANPKRMRENLQALNFKLSTDDLKDLESLNINYRFNPSTQWQGFGGVDIFA
jgi:diketogulonate reductase-like aldo/keto reductase